MMKIFLILLVVFFSITLPNEVVHPPLALSRIIASSVKISPSKRKTGSGNVIESRGKLFILTNAHVCLPNSEMLANSKLYESKKESEFIFKIKTLQRKKILKLRVKLKQLKYNSYYDVCLIPLPLEIPVKALPYPDKTPKLLTQKKYFFFNFNNKQGILRTKTLFNKDNYFVPNADIGYTTAEKKESHRTRGEYYRLEGKVIAGDSGSLVFNDNYELIGQVFGSNYSKTEPQGSMLEKKFLDALLDGSLKTPEISQNLPALEELKY